MQSLLHFSLAIYLLFYAFEAPIRYVFSLIGMDELIWLRDVMIALPILLLFAQQALNKNIHPAYIFFGFAMGLHGAVMMANIGSVSAVTYGIKMFMTMLAGALAARWFFNPSKKAIAGFLVLWCITIIGIVLDKYVLQFPWHGMSATLGGLDVDVSKDWMVSGADKRAAGFLRSSIFAALFLPLTALILIYHIRSTFLRGLFVLLTIPGLYWTTQKASLLAFILVIGMITLCLGRTLTPLKLGVGLAIFLMIGLPLMLPGYHMPETEGVFSFASFYMRIEEVWPDALGWIDRREAFPFGVGLGGIGGPMRLYAPLEVNYADNCFIFLYANFGVMAFVYLALLIYAVFRLPRRFNIANAHAISVIAFLLLYGIAITMVEDQIASLFLGAAIAWVASSQKKSPALSPKS